MKALSVDSGVSELFGAHSGCFFEDLREVVGVRISDTGADFAYGYLGLGEEYLCKIDPKVQKIGKTCHGSLLHEDIVEFIPVDGELFCEGIESYLFTYVFVKEPGDLSEGRLVQIFHAFFALGTCKDE